MALGIVNLMKLSHIKNNLLTPMQSYKRTPNIFYASSSKIKNQSCILSIFINKPSLCRGSKRYFISKRLIRPSKDTIISKIHTFSYNFKHSVETLSVYISLV